MTYDEFIKQLKEIACHEMKCPADAIRFYPKGYKSDKKDMYEWIRDVNIKYTGTEDDSLQVDIMAIDMEKVGQISNQYRFATRRMYEDALEKGFDSVFKEITDLHNKTKITPSSKKAMEIRGTGDYEAIKNQLILRPLNYTLHARDLKGCVYQKVNDFVLCLYQMISDDGKNLLTSRINRSELELWDVAVDLAIQSALENSARLFPPCVYDNRTRQEENLLEKEFSKRDISIGMGFHKHILLSTFRTTNGALALFYPGVVEKIMKIMDGPFQAVFMNTSDVMIFDKDDKSAYSYADSSGGLDSMGEVLSKKVYLCDGDQMLPRKMFKLYPNRK